MTIIDLCAGPGGWEEGLRDLGRDDAAGLEVDADVIRTRHLAGHRTTRIDVAATDPARFAAALGPIEGLIASPPCPAFSRAGNRDGVREMPELIARIRAAAEGWRDDLRAGYLAGDDLFDTGRWQHPTTPLVLEPLRWALTLRPTWVACEQVPDVLPAWEATADVLRMRGYETWCGLLNSADYGVPQTRVRAILIAHQTRRVGRPAPTHAKGGADGLAPWVSMATALGWGPGRVRTGANTMVTRAGDLEPYERSVAEPAPTVLGNAGRWLWTSGALPDRPNRNGAVRHESEPAPTLAVGHAVPTWLNTGRDWKPGGTRDDCQHIDVADPAPAVTAKAGGQWWWERPATTVCGDARIFAPGHHPNAADGPDAGSRNDGAVKVTLAEMLVLQSFRPDYPICGRTVESRFRQVGNAVPPRLAAAILAELVT